MGSLTPIERSALVMTALEGIPYEEAARVLGTSAGALRAAVSRPEPSWRQRDGAQPHRPDPRRVVVGGPFCHAARPAARGAATSVAGAGISLAGAAVLVVALVAVFAVLGNRPSQTSPGALPSASPSPSVAFASPEPPRRPGDGDARTLHADARAGDAHPVAPRRLQRPRPRDADHDVGGAAGSRIGPRAADEQWLRHVQHAGHLATNPRRWHGRDPDRGHPSTTATRITLPAGQTVTTLVLVSNYCGPTLRRRSPCRSSSTVPR
jgi:hypothetical protein